jgi:hypothetical protein
VSPLEVSVLDALMRVHSHLNLIQESLEAPALLKYQHTGAQELARGLLYAGASRGNGASSGWAPRPEQSPLVSC